MHHSSKALLLYCLCGMFFWYLLCFWYNKLNQEIWGNYHAVWNNIIVNQWSKKDQSALYNTLCKNNKNLCNKIKYIGDYTKEEQETYGMMAIYFIKTIDKNIISWKKIMNILDEITISSEENTRRGYSTHTNVFLHTPWVSYKEFMMVLVHELWHIVDLWTIEWTNKEKSIYFTEFGEEMFSLDDLSLKYYAISRDSEDQKKSIERKWSFCSIYGMSNPFEDFAECFHLYINHNEYFRAMMWWNKQLQRKYSFIRALMKWKYLYNTLQEIGHKNDSDHRYRDTTRMN